MTNQPNMAPIAPATGPAPLVNDPPIETTTPEIAPAAPAPAVETKNI